MESRSSSDCDRLELLGEAELREIPKERLPNINPLDLRLYMIGRKTCQQIDAFIQAHRQDAVSRYTEYLGRLRQVSDRKLIDKHNS